MLERPALWVISNERGVYERKNDFIIWQAWLRLESFESEKMVTSRLSENQADSLSASPIARYLAIGLNTS